MATAFIQQRQSHNLFQRKNWQKRQVEFLSVTSQTLLHGEKKRTTWNIDPDAIFPHIAPAWWHPPVIRELLKNNMWKDSIYKLLGARN